METNVPKRMTEHDLDPPTHCIEPSCPACCCYIDPDGAPKDEEGR